jgi:hypothetical protein
MARFLKVPKFKEFLIVTAKLEKWKKKSIWQEGADTLRYKQSESMSH